MVDPTGVTVKPVGWLGGVGVVSLRQMLPKAVTWEEDWGILAVAMLSMLPMKAAVAVGSIR